VKKGHLILLVATIGTVIAAPAYSQGSVSSATSAQNETPALRVAVFVAPPSVFEEDGSLTVSAEICRRVCIL